MSRPLVRTSLYPAVILLLLHLPATFGQSPGEAQAEPAPTVNLADARDLLMTGSYERAVEAFENLAADARYALEAELGLARCHHQTGEYEKAIDRLTRVAADDSADWHHLLAVLHGTVGNYDKVLAHVRGAITRNGNHAGARLLLAQTLELLGKQDDAVQAYRWFDEQIAGRMELPRDAEWITDTALGFLRYSVLTRTELARRTKHVLNEMLQVAYERVDRTYWPARIAAADLLREKYNNDVDDGSVSDYQAALRINENLPQAFVGLGEVALERWDFEEIERRVDAALSVNRRYAPAIHLLAKKLLLERRYEQASEACERALQINPNDLHALSIDAAAAACRFDEAEVGRLASRGAAINPRCALFHRTLGDALSGIRQYAASEREYAKAIELDPADANAQTELGMMYMQWGEEEKARNALDRAWNLDPFNERTEFTLELLEMLEKFDRVETEHFIVKYDAAHDPGLGEFAAAQMEQIYESVTGDYEAAPSSKTIIELFPTHRAFGVRITGKPWIHTIGASTGRVIALASPRDRARLGPYNIARVLEHEFTHTVTLEATQNRIPHWFTEGLAVYQEDAPRSFHWCELLADAVRHDRLFTLESIDWGFIRPRRPDDRQLAYAQSEWMCQYIVERSGYDALNAMIRRFRLGHTQQRVFAEQLAIEPSAFDTAFLGWARQQAAGWGFDLTPPENVEALRQLAEATPDDADVLGRLAKAELDHGEPDRALAIANSALKLDENQPVALEVFAEVLASYARDEGNKMVQRALDEQALPLLERLLPIAPDGWIAPKYLAEIALRREELDRAMEMLKRLQRVCPLDPASWRGLAGIYLKRGDEDRALPQLLELARMEPNDPDIPARIAAILERRGQLQEAIYWYQTALCVDPFSIELHRALGDASMKSGDTTGALSEYKMLTLLEPENARYFEKAAFAAHKLGDEAAALKYSREAVRLDPSSSAGALVP